LQLRDIDDAARILLIEQRFAVGPVIGEGIAKDRKPLVILRMAILDDGDLPCLAVHVRGIIGDVDPLPVVALVVPPIEQGSGMVVRDGGEEG
jgi:hypothetical protein